MTIAIDLADLRVSAANMKRTLADLTAAIAKLRARPIVFTGSITLRAAADQPLPPMAAAMLRRHGLTASAADSPQELSAAMRAAGMKPEDRMVVLRSIERAKLGLPA